jgi:hypothetical protein
MNISVLRKMELPGPNPGCSLCDQPAVCDVPTSMGPWGYLCKRHAASVGRGTADLGHAIRWTDNMDHPTF